MRRRGRQVSAGGGECQGCGTCCVECGDVLAAEEGDLDRWRREGRDDLLNRVGAGGALWVDPATGAPLDHCPFLERGADDRARCAIHATKPDMCRAYPDLAHGFHCFRGVRFGPGRERSHLR